MGLRSRIATFGMRRTRRMFRTLFGTELVVETSDHSIEISMERPGPSSSRAWDPHLFKRGQLFVKGYANPIKPVVETRHELGESDRVSLTEGEIGKAREAYQRGEIDEEELEDRIGSAIASDLDELEDEELGGRSHKEIISSGRYRQYMHQELISQLLNPREQWKLIVYAVLALAFLMVVNLVVTLQITGVFG